MANWHEDTIEKQLAEIQSLTQKIWDLTSQNSRLVKFLEAQEAWEAAVLNDDGPWFDQMPEHLIQAFEEVQRLRNEAK